MLLSGRPVAAGPDADAGDRMLGVVLANPAPPPLPELWAENEPAALLFRAMRTQLRTSGWTGHVEGFDYTALPVVERRLRLRPRVARDVFPDLQVMEREMVSWFAERAAQ